MKAIKHLELSDATIQNKPAANADLRWKRPVFAARDLIQSAGHALKFDAIVQELVLRGNHVGKNRGEIDVRVGLKAAVRHSIRIVEVDQLIYLPEWLDEEGKPLEEYKPKVLR